MKRYQLYLNPHSVSILDDFEGISDISRSKLIRKLVDSMAEQLIRIFAERKRAGKKGHILDSLVGFVDLKTNKKTNFSQNIDEIYFTD